MTMTTDGQFIVETAWGAYNNQTGVQVVSLLLADGTVPDFDALVTACKSTVGGTRLFVGSTLLAYVTTTLARNVLVKTMLSTPVQFKKGGVLQIDASTAKENPLVLKTGVPTWGILALRQSYDAQLFDSAYSAAGLILFSVGAKGSGADVELTQSSPTLLVDQVFKLGDISIAIQNIIT